MRHWQLCPCIWLAIFLLPSLMSSFWFNWKLEGSSGPSCYCLTLPGEAFLEPIQISYCHSYSSYPFSGGCFGNSAFSALLQVLRHYCLGLWWVSGPASTLQCSSCSTRCSSVGWLVVWVGLGRWVGCSGKHLSNNLKTLGKLDVIFVVVKWNFTLYYLFLLPSFKFPRVQLL